SDGQSQRCRGHLCRREIPLAANRCPAVESRGFLPDLGPFLAERSAVRTLQLTIFAITLALVGGTFVALARAQDFLAAMQPLDIAPPSSTQQDAAKCSEADNANLEGCQVIARVDDQVVLACEVLWHVNLLLEQNQVKATPDRIEGIRQELMKREVMTMVDRKLLYNEFRRGVPPGHLPKIEENLRQPFEERELPDLMKQLKVDNQRDLEIRLAQLGSSLADVRRGFNERVVAQEWIRSKVKVNEDVGPDEMIDYYRTHLTDYDYPSQARWEELMVRKDRFKDPAEAYAEVAQLGNQVWQNGTQKPVRGAAFAEI